MSSSSFSDLASNNESDILETSHLCFKNTSGLHDLVENKVEANVAKMISPAISKKKSFANDFNQNNKREKLCSTKKCICLLLVFMFLAMDILLNIFFVTDSFEKAPSFIEYDISHSLIDLWFISIARDLFLFIIILCVAIRHKFISGFIKFIHKKYISAFLTLIMYSFAMIKMLLHSDTRQVKQNSMFMFIWNVIAGFLFFICWYMLRLLKHKILNYRKTDIDGGDLDENAKEEDIFIGRNLIIFLKPVKI